MILAIEILRALRVCFFTDFSVCFWYFQKDSNIRMLGLPSKRIFVLELTNSIFVAFLKKNQDPNTNKIKQILGARDSTGVITNFLEVDTQPVLGDWKIKVMAHVSHYFIDIDWHFDISKYYSDTLICFCFLSQGKSTEKTFTIAHYGKNNFSWNNLG